jgi:hypothetical protein
MRKLLMAALVCGGAFAFAAPSLAAPLSAAGSLGNEATRSAVNETVGDEAITQVRYGRGRYYGGRHYGWNRGHHYGWRNHGWRHRYYGGGPRYYGYAPYRHYRYW